MTREEKDLLKDLCARLPYGVKALYYGSEEEMLTVDTIEAIYTQPSVEIVIGQYGLELDDVKPYLRPLSTMTEEEARDIAILHGYDPVEILSTKVTDKYVDIIHDDCAGSTITSTIWYDGIISSLECFDYLNKKMFDFRGLIPKSLALSTEFFNPYEEQKENLVMKLLQTACGLFGHKWVSYTKGQMCKRCGKKKNMDKWYYETKKQKGD